MSDFVKDINVPTNDCISRQAAIDVADSTDYLGLSIEDVKKVTDEVVKGLKCLPSAQPERKKGKWIRNDNNTWLCDQCRSWIPDEQHYYARYCLYCGADMRGEQDE